MKPPTSPYFCMLLVLLLEVEVNTDKFTYSDFIALYTLAVAAGRI